VRILICPMATFAETGGSMTRTRALALAALKRGHTVAFCAGEDLNFRPLEGIFNYVAPIPAPLGLPPSLGPRIFPIAKGLGIQQRVAIKDFEQVLHLIGAIGGKFFRDDAECVRQAIRDFRPDVVLAEHRVSPLAAAKLEGLPSAAIYSAPIDRSRWIKSYGKYSAGVRAYLRSNSLPEVQSALDIYDWASLKIVPSSPELEPIDSPRLSYVGALIENMSLRRPGRGVNIIAYMGNGTISARRLIRVLSGAFKGSSREVYIATKELAPFDAGNIHVAGRFDFDELLPSSAVFISHGGQNSMIQSLMNAVPLIVCPGKVFERQYNAQSVQRLRVGKAISEPEFSAGRIIELCRELETDDSYKRNAIEVGQKLLSLGGVEQALHGIEAIVARTEEVSRG
jgi:hypothetical protein